MRFLHMNPCSGRAPAGKSKAALDRLSHAVNGEHAGRIALVSSFGAEAAVLLHMVSKVAPELPVLLNETGMLFPETLLYQRELTKLLRLSNVQLVRPEKVNLNTGDPDGTLHQRDSGACCRLRKVLPLKRALGPYAAWISGRKRFQAETRAQIGFAERDEDGRVKFNPLADWLPEDVAQYFEVHCLPRHPLVSRGYPSIGCAPCTSSVGEGEDARAGRWRGSAKTECGIHIVDGKVLGGAA